MIHSLIKTFVPSIFLTQQIVRSMEYYRHDGVRITHDPYDPKMMEKYGKPGETDNEGFDPYADSVGPGIYGGIVKRDADGQIEIGAQYQNHNKRPGPVYAGGGYTPINAALKNTQRLEELLEHFPDLVNDISTGGAQPLHMCGMNTRNQYSVNLLVKFGADIEAKDTYGFTPLLRMASNNLASGARALLEAGADPNNRGGAGVTPMECAQQSCARDVITFLEKWGTARKPTNISKIVVQGSSVDSVNREYLETSSDQIPIGFDKVCKAQGWPTEKMWKKLNEDKTWYKADNDAYIYWNTLDSSWWIDKPDGMGIFKASGPSWAPPQQGWKILTQESHIIPSSVATFRRL